MLSLLKIKGIQIFFIILVFPTSQVVHIILQGETPINIGPEMCDRDTSSTLDPTIVPCG